MERRRRFAGMTTCPSGHAFASLRRRAGERRAGGAGGTACAFDVALRGRRSSTEQVPSVARVTVRAAHHRPPCGGLPFPERSEGATGRRPGKPEVCVLRPLNAFGPTLGSTGHRLRIPVKPSPPAPGRTSARGRRYIPGYVPAKTRDRASASPKVRPCPAPLTTTAPCGSAPDMLRALHGHSGADDRRSRRAVGRTGLPAHAASSSKPRAGEWPPPAEWLTVPKGGAPQPPRRVPPFAPLSLALSCPSLRPRSRGRERMVGGWIKRVKQGKKSGAGANGLRRTETVRRVCCP